MLAGRSRKGLRPPNEISYNSDRNICLLGGLTSLIYVNVLPGHIVVSQASFLPHRRIPFPLSVHSDYTIHSLTPPVNQANFKLQTNAALENTREADGERVMGVGSPGGDSD